MSYDAVLAEPIRRRLGQRPDVSEKPMFSGLALLIGGRMSVGVAENELTVRVGKDAHDAFVSLPGAGIMDTTSCWIAVGPQGYTSDADHQLWIDRGVSGAEAVSERARGRRRGGRVRTCGHEPKLLRNRSGNVEMPTPTVPT